MKRHTCTLYKRLKATGKRYISIEDFIRKNARTRAIKKLRLEFEVLLNSNHNDISYERTSEIFITKGTKRGERNLIYFPIFNGYLISHIVIKSNKKQ